MQKSALRAQKRLIWKISRGFPAIRDKLKSIVFTSKKYPAPPPGLHLGNPPPAGAAALGFLSRLKARKKGSDAGQFALVASLKRQ
ncbi:hypothetical protein [Chelativorans sp. AA-79]|uniref:hypothetical protein n=1 Tax=Chelativorans sp. AA-79 TaxID=3028735 RepID=UPI0023F6A3FC|nr:hypothetical protein [Chelativorans sp. AA-79]WEX08819.1 hypothetical protein PVE73_22585 [Chelativorans sp. AA-79]